jgi:hypothetical protein
MATYTELEQSLLDELYALLADVGYASGDHVFYYAKALAELRNTDAGAGRKFYYSEDTSASANTINLAVAGVNSYMTGDTFVFKAANGNTGGVTLNINNMGGVSIKKSASVDLASGDIVAGQITLVTYDGTNFQVISGSGGSGGSGGGDVDALIVKLRTNQLLEDDILFY